MMKNRTLVVAGVLALALAVLPVPSALAGGPHGGYYRGGYYGGGPLWGLAGAVVATAAAIITAPIAILAAITQPPPYYGPGPAYGAPAAGGYYGPAPAYYGAPPQA